MRTRSLAQAIVYLGAIGQLALLSGCGSEEAASITKASTSAGSGLDSSFDRNGKLVQSLGTGFDVSRAVAIQSDGKIVLAGSVASASSVSDFALVRLNSDGSLDSTFGTLGVTQTDIASGEDVGRAIAIQPDGMILVAGSAVNGTSVDFSVARYDANGVLDPTFGTSGKVTIHFGTGDDSANAILVQADGTILVGGPARNVADVDFGFARLTSVGALDTSFDVDGKALIDASGADDELYALAIKSDGKIVAAGSGGGDFAIAELSSAGALNASFGSGGIVITDFGSGNDAAYGIAIGSDDSILAAGEARGDLSMNVGIARYTASGALDTTFDLDGTLSLDVAGGDDRASSIALGSSGEIILGGYAHTGTSFDYLVAKVNLDGSMIQAFGTDGVLTTDVSGSHDLAHAMAIQSDGKLVLTGQSYGDSGSYDFSVVRYKP